MKVPTEGLERIRSAATERGMSLQSYLRDALRAQAAYLRRQNAVARAAQRFQGRSAVPEVARDAVLDAVDAAQAGRGEQRGDPRR